MKHKSVLHICCPSEHAGLVKTLWSVPSHDILRHSTPQMSIGWLLSSKSYMSVVAKRPSLCFPMNLVRSVRSPRAIQVSKFPSQRRTLATSTFQHWRRDSIAMATPYKIHLSVEDTGVVKFQDPTAESAAKASELLQKNHDVCIINASGTYCSC